MDNKQLNNEKLNDVNGGRRVKSACLSDEQCNTTVAATIKWMQREMLAGDDAAGAAVSKAAKCGCAKSGLIDELDVAEAAAKYGQSVPVWDIPGALKR